MVWVNLGGITIIQYVLMFCVFMKGPWLLPKFRVKSFLAPGQSLETQVEAQLYSAVKSGLMDLLGARSYFASKVLTPYCYTLGTIVIPQLNKV